MPPTKPSLVPPKQRGPERHAAKPGGHQLTFGGATVVGNARTRKPSVGTRGARTVVESSPEGSPVLVSSSSVASPTSSTAEVLPKMSRRLRDARAAVKAPFRPETPYDVLQPGPSAPKKGSRLTALLSSGSAPSQLVSSTSTLNAANFVARLAAAKDDSGAAINLLRDLMRWLSNPTHLIWPELLTYGPGAMDREIRRWHSLRPPSSSTTPPWWTAQPWRI